ncbi:MAG: Holliday junction resolvase RuvX [bacterium]|nr:Holliday junction resolvase RuvX [bacterium]
MRIMGIDFGSKRVGIAISDEDEKIAFPTVVLPNDKNLLNEVHKICEANKVGEVVFGESNDLDGKPNPIMKKIEDFKKKAAEKIKVPFKMEPEFFTSVEAERIQGKTEMQDASAAALILQNHLDKHQK